MTKSSQNQIMDCVKSIRDEMEKSQSTMGAKAMDIELPEMMSVHLNADIGSKAAAWQPIETLDREQMQLVLVREEGAVRLHMWNPRGLWEHPYPIGSIVDDGDCCSAPTHWMPIPD